MRIGEREIGLGHKPYVIAEIGVNHDGDVARALELVDGAAQAGADAVKLQHFETDRLMSRASKLAAYQKAAGETDPIEMLRRLELTLDEQAVVVERAHQRGVHAIVSVFSMELVERAETLPWDAYKTASPDIINRPLLDALVATGKPMIMSTGASTLDEVRRALGWLEPAHERLAVLQCVSAYPAPEAAFGGIRALMRVFGGPVGYSDHHASDAAAERATALGASVLEKHITYDPKAAGPDHAASSDVRRFDAYIAAASSGWKQRLGAVESEAQEIKSVLDCEQDVRRVSRQSLVAKRDLMPGEVIVRGDLTIKRPGTGVAPWRIDEVIGRTVAAAIEMDWPIEPAVVGIEP